MAIDVRENRKRDVDRKFGQADPHLPCIGVGFRWPCRQFLGQPSAIFPGRAWLLVEAEKSVQGFHRDQA